MSKIAQLLSHRESNLTAAQELEMHKANLQLLGWSQREIHDTEQEAIPRAATKAKVGAMTFADALNMAFRVYLERAARGNRPFVLNRYEAWHCRGTGVCAPANHRDTLNMLRDPQAILVWEAEAPDPDTALEMYGQWLALRKRGQ